MFVFDTGLFSTIAIDYDYDSSYIRQIFSFLRKLSSSLSQVIVTKSHV